jgi:hypothetical protein
MFLFTNHRLLKRLLKRAVNQITTCSNVQMAKCQEKQDINFQSFMQEKNINNDK